MPTHRGIQISVVSQQELKLHPEFPHPESSQFTYRSPDTRKGTAKFADWTPPSASSDSKADRLLGRQSVVSVYIPSMPATRFWMRYNITEAAAHSEWFYFKLFMNGRHITSWGTNAKTKPSGQVMRGLFEPSDRWNYKLDGTLYRNMGTEARPFIFGHEEKDRSAAKDGGLIEVMVFRARGRKRKLPKPSEFKNQQGYGIIMPSGGLLDKPEEAKFYDWNLKDPKDSPFATFKFHYRSWESLMNLQLIPDNHPRALLTASPSILSLNGLSEELYSKLEEDTHEEEREAIENLKRSMSSIISNDPWLTTVFDDSPEHSPINQNNRSGYIVPSNTSPISSANRRAGVPTSRFSAVVIDKPASPQSSWKGYTERPLPEIPTRDSSLKRQQNDASSRSRSSSGISHSPSIAASLLPYIDRDSVSPEPVIGIAQKVTVEVSTSPIPPPSPSLSLSSLSSLTTSPPKATKSKRQGIASPPVNTVFSMPDITIRKTRRSSPKRLSKTAPDYYANSPSYSPTPAPLRLQIQTLAAPPHINTYNDDHDNDIENDRPPLDTSQNTLSLSITESEWMCRTPSPVKALPRFGSLQKMWSPGLRVSRDTSAGMVVVKEKESGYVSEHEHVDGHGDVENKTVKARKGSGTPFRRRTRDWYERVKTPGTANNLSGAEGDESDRPMEGNWI